MMYKSFYQECLERFGCKVYKLSLDGGFTCPNRDGTVGTGGCVFCSAYGGGEFAAGPCGNIAQQLELAKARVAAKNKGGKYMAYFQSFTGTYAPVERLRQLYYDAIAPEDVVALSIGTRPDCVSDDVLNLLKEINGKKPVTVELGLQTCHPESIAYIRRGYENDVYLDAVRRLKAAGIQVVTHIILGIPGESSVMAAQTTSFAVDAGTDGVKFHLLHVLKNTDLEKDYLEGKFRCLELEEYARWLKECIAQLPHHVVVHRITGDGAKRDLVAPLWSADKKRVLNYLNKELQ